MKRAVENFVRQRAQFRCEYCQMPQAYDGFTHEIDHIIAQKHHGVDDASNLCLACFPCNNHKAANVAGIDPVSKKITRLYDPRRHQWHKHFRWEDAMLVGVTRIGRATVDVLKINDPDRVLLRESLIDEGVFPRRR